MENIRLIDSELICSTVCELLVHANHKLPDSVAEKIKCAADIEKFVLAESVLNDLSDNLKAAVENGIPICQDTGMAVVFVKVGKNVHITGESLEEAVNRGVRKAYIDGAMRLSIVRDPLYDRTNTGDNSPAIIHLEMNGDETIADNVVITVAPKGFGSENMSALKMMTPSATENDIVNFVIDSVVKAGSNPCPPIFVGVGIGADFEGCALLAKKALLRDTPSVNPKYAALEERILREINDTGIGPQGFGGDTTALAVMIESAPTHIAGLPVAVNINCHVSRHETRII